MAENWNLIVYLCVIKSISAPISLKFRLNIQNKLLASWSGCTKLWCITTNLRTSVTLLIQKGMEAVTRFRLTFVQNFIHFNYYLTNWYTSDYCVYSIANCGYPYLSTNLFWSSVSFADCTKRLFFLQLNPN